MATKATSYLSPGLPPVIPQLVIKGARAAIELYGKAFGAEAGHVMPGSNGGVMHAALKIGEATVFLSDANEFSKPTAANTMLYVKDVDATFARATAAGCTVLAPLTDMFWGDRWAMLADPFGNTWQLATHKEDVSPEEMQQRIAALPK